MPSVAALSEGPLFGLPLPDLWFGLLFLVLATFLFLDGFDFGVGAIFATRDDEAERERLLAAIGPFWDGNEVWLVVFGGTLFAVFPAVYANLLSRQYLPTFGVLGALLLRGLAPEMYEQRHDERWRRWWGRSFVVGSVATPFLLGVFLANWVTGSTAPVTPAGVTVGLALVALTVVDGVAFLRLKVRSDRREDLRSTGIRALAAYLVLLGAAVASLALFAPALRPALGSPAVLGLLAATLGVAAVYAIATRRDRYRVAFGATAGLVVAFVGVVAASLHPALDPATGLTVEAAAVPTLSLNLVTLGGALLLPLVALYFVVLYAAFGGPVEAGEGY